MLDAVIAKGEASLSDAAVRTGIPASTALRHLRVLTDHGYLVKDGFGTYSAGPAFVRNALASLRSGPYARLAAAAQPGLERLVDATEESAYLAVRDRSEAVYIATVESRRAIRHVGWVGRSVPVDGTAVGAVLLAPPQAPGARPQTGVQHRRHRTRRHRGLRPDLRLLGRGRRTVGAGTGQPAGRPTVSHTAAQAIVEAAMATSAVALLAASDDRVTVELDGPGVTISDVVAVARHGRPVSLSQGALARMGRGPGR